MDESLAPATVHQSVLLEEAVAALEIKLNDIVVDSTVGGAGHFGLLRSLLDTDGTLIGIDADRDALNRAQVVVDGNPVGPTIHLVEDNFRNLPIILQNQGIGSITKSLFDLGWSAFHLTRGRGFSFQIDEPLLMTYGDPDSQATASDVVNSLPESELADMLYQLGEEQFGRKIAKGIVEARHVHKIETTFELVAVVEASTPVWYHHRRIHPATKTFQALRLYVNDELGALSDGLTAAIECTSSGGRIAVITFHSIEDRIVKHLFRDAVDEGKGTLVYKKPRVPSPEELSRNPRARSAKLRVFECR